MSFDQSTTPSQQRSIRPLLFALLILTLLILASYIGRLRSLSALDQQIAAEEIQVGQALSRQQMLQDQEARQQDASEESIDQAARRDLNLVKPGDFTFTVLTPVPSSILDIQPTPEPDTPVREATSPKPNWKQWIELLIPPQGNE